MNPEQIEWDIPEVGSITGGCVRQFQGRPFSVSNALVAPGSATDDNDYAMLRLRSGKMEKVVPIAGQKNAAGIMGKPEYNLVRGIVGRDLRSNVTSWPRCSSK